MMLIGSFHVWELPRSVKHVDLLAESNSESADYSSTKIAYILYIEYCFSDINGIYGMIGRDDVDCK